MICYELVAELLRFGELRKHSLMFVKPRGWAKLSCYLLAEVWPAGSGSQATLYQPRNISLKV